MAANALQGKVSEFQYPGIVTNFYRALLAVDIEHQTLCAQVLLNKVYPLIAIAAPAEYNYLNLEFLDSALSKQFDYEYKVLSKQELETPFNPNESLAGILLEAEISQIKYWLPQRVGDVIFNFWD